MQRAHFDYCLDVNFDNIDDSTTTTSSSTSSLSSGDEIEKVKNGCFYNISSNSINLEGMTEGKHNISIRARVNDISYDIVDDDDNDDIDDDDDSSSSSNDVTVDNNIIRSSRVLTDGYPSVVIWEVDVDAPDTALLTSQPIEFMNNQLTTHLQSVSFVYASSEFIKLFQVQLSDDDDDWLDLNLRLDNKYCIVETVCSLVVSGSSRRRKLENLNKVSKFDTETSSTSTSTPRMSSTSRIVMVEDDHDIKIQWYFSSSQGGQNYEKFDIITLLLHDLSQGPHTVSVRSVDEANNYDASPSQFSFVVDTSLKPNIPSTPSAVSAIAGNKYINVSWLPPQDCGFISDDSEDGSCGDDGINYYQIVGYTSFTENTMIINHYVNGGGSSSSSSDTTGITYAIDPYHIDSDTGRYYTQVPNLQNKNIYKFSVLARNMNGAASALSWTSDWATPSDPTDPCSTVNCNDDDATQ